MIDQLFEIIAGSDSGALAYLIIFTVLVASGLGFPLPEDIPLIAAGYLIGDGHTTFLGSFLVSMIGIGIGDSVLYWLGRKLGMRLLDPNRKKPLFAPRRVSRVKAYFRKYGDKIVFFARFVAGFRAVAFFMAGALKMKYRTFILYDGIAAALSVPVWIGIGYGLHYYLGDHIELILKRVGQFKMGASIVIGIVILVLVIRFIYKYRVAQRALRLAQAAEASSNLTEEK